ncbi:PAS domain S-box protein [candidate division FCPU426 bacterium]|nr:PAS domain S-box protein [candidate division FCPU426 bacterium]
MPKNPFLVPQGELNQAYEELDHITKMLIKRDVLLTETNLELEKKNRDLEMARLELLRISQYLTNLFTNSPDGIWVLDSLQRVNTFNKMAEELTGYKTEEVIGRPLDFIFAEPNKYQELMQNLPEAKNYFNVRSRIRCKNGQTAEILMSLSLLREEGVDGQPIGSMTIFKDITREIRLEEALREVNERLEEKVRQRTNELEVLSQTLLVLNHVSTVASQSLELDTLLNNILRLVLELTGFTMGIVSPVAGHDHIEVRAHTNMPPELLARVLRIPIGEGIIGRAASNGFLQVASPDMPEMLAAEIRLVVAVPLRAKGAIQGVMTLFSKMERKVLEEEWDIFMAIGVQAGWAIENAWLYEQVREDVVKLKEVDRIKTEFIATISHELRTPLTSIIGFLSYANTALEKYDPKKLHRYINIALENGQKLSNMIEDLLAMQKLDSGTLSLHYEKISLYELFEEISVDLGPQLQMKEQDLVMDLVESLPPLTADREQIERALTNLVVNAVKFSEGPGTITLSARHLPEKAQYMLAVSDTGIGMSPEVQQRIFERFFQAENALTRRKGGAGLGLTIAKRIIEMHHGVLEVESEPHCGSRFIIFLPDTPAVKEEKEETNHGK